MSLAWIKTCTVKGFKLLFCKSQHITLYNTAFDKYMQEFYRRSRQFASLQTTRTASTSRLLINQRLIGSGTHPAFNDDHWLVTDLLCFQSSAWWNKQESHENHQRQLSLSFLPPFCLSRLAPKNFTLSLMLYTFVSSLFNYIHVWTLTDVPVYAECQTPL